MAQDLALAQSHAFALSRTLMVPVTLFRSGNEFGVLPRGQNKSCSKSYAKTERSGNVMQRGGFFQEVAMA